MNWQILSANGNLPGSTIASGNAQFSDTEFVGIGFGSYTITKFNYDLPSVALGAGNYYLGFQAVSSIFQVYLGQVSMDTGTAQSNDGGINWFNDYQGYPGYPGIASSLSGNVSDVPEPASWVMMIAGFGLVGAAMRRRSAAFAG